MNTVNKCFSRYYILLLLTTLPLYVENAYFDIIEAKFKAFACIFLIHLIPVIILMIVYKLRLKNQGRTHLDIIDVGILCFGGSSLISSLISEDTAASFWGFDGWYIGAFSIISLVFLYFFFSRIYKYTQNIWMPVYIVNSIIFIIGIIQFGGIDILGYTENILKKQYYQYISTYGNTNWYAGYLCMLLPIAFVFFLAAKRRTSYWFNLTFLIIGIFNLLICISDGAYLGLGLCAFFAIPYVCASTDRIKRTLVIGMIYSLEVLIINILPCYKKLLSYVSGISALVLDVRICIGILILSVCFWIVITKSRKREKMGKILCIVCELTLVLGVMIVMVHTLNNFSDKWGSSRGLIWRVSFERFSDFDIKRKLFGIGPELLREQYTEVQRKFENLAVLSSHSEPIQILLTMGISGLIFWIIIQAGVIRRFIKTRRTDENSVLVYAFFLAIIAYTGQSFVNSATIVNLCLLCIVYSFFVNVAVKNVK